MVGANVAAGRAGVVAFASRPSLRAVVIEPLTCLGTSCTLGFTRNEERTRTAPRELPIDISCGLVRGR